MKKGTFWKIDKRGNEYFDTAAWLKSILIVPVVASIIYGFIKIFFM